MLPVAWMALGFALAGVRLEATIESWTNVEGRTMEAEVVGRSGEFVVFRKADGVHYRYAYAQLVEEDRVRVDARIAALPPEQREVLLASASARTEQPLVAAAAPSAPPPPAPGKLAVALEGKLVRVERGSTQALPRDHLSRTRFVAIYQSAQWCPPCRAFTPELVAAYREIKARHPEFELIFVSSDRNAKAMQTYMAEYGMVFPAVRFDQVRSTRELRRPDYERGIPNLIFMDADGRELSVSYLPDGTYRGPRAVLRDIRRHFGVGG
jgi:nucleoredoxin